MSSILDPGQYPFKPSVKAAATRYSSIVSSTLTGEMVARMWTTMPDGDRKYFLASRDHIERRLTKTFGHQREQWALALAALDHHLAMRGVVDIAAAQA